VGGNSSGSSRLHVVTSIEVGALRCSYVRGVPHAAQKVRRTGSDERNSVALPCSHSNWEVGNVIHATTGAAATRRHERQCHTMLLVGFPRTR